MHRSIALDKPTENTWNLRFSADPFVASFADSRLDCGTSLAAAVEPIGIPAQHLALFIDGEHVPAGVWPMVRPKPGVLVHARAVPGGPAALAVSGLASWWGSTALTVAGFGITWGQIAGVALTFALSALSTSLFAPETPSFEREQPEPVYSITSARNEAAPWEAIPIVMGTHRVAPRLGAPVYTEIIGEDQYLRMMLLWGPGPVAVGDVRIGNTPIEDFEGVEMENDLDGSQSTMTLYPGIVTQENIGVLMEPLTPVTRTTEDDTGWLSFTFSFPSGLIRYRDSDGADKSHTVWLSAYYRTAGTSDPWVKFYEYLVERKTTRPFFVASYFQFPSVGEWEVYFERSQAGDGDNTYVEDVQILNMKSYSPGSPVNLPGVAKTVIRIRAGDQLNSVIDRVNALVAREVAIWNGGNWLTTGYSSNPAALFRDVCQGSGIAAGRTIATDDASLGAWYEFCEARGLIYEAYYTTQQPVMDRLTEIAAAGMASPHRASGIMGVVIDQPQSTVVQHITPRNSFGFSGAIDYPDQPHALRVQFNNRDEDYEPDEIIVYDDGYDETTATKFDVIRPAGVSYYSQAYLMGRHFLASGRLRPERWTVSMDFENLVATRGDLVRFTHDVALIGQASARITAISGNDVTLDEVVTFSAGTTHALRVRSASGTSLLQFAAGSGTTQTVTVSDSTGMAVGDLAMFGAYSQESVLALVHDIRHADDMQATLTLIPYNADVYNAWNAIPEYTANISAPVSASRVGPLAPEVVYIISDEAALPKDFSGVPLPAILVRLIPGTLLTPNAKVTPAVGFRVGYRKTGSDASYTYFAAGLDEDVRIVGVETGEAYDLRMFAVDGVGATSDPVIVGGHVVAGLVAQPPAVDTFRVANRGASAYVEWTYPSIVGDVVGFEIRWHPDQAVTEWSRMVRLATNIPRTARSFMVPATYGSYAIKAFDALGYRSATALYVSSNISDPRDTNVIETFTETSSFAGTMDGVAEVSGRLQLDSQSMVSDWTDLSTITDIAGEVTLSGTYTFWSAQDLGAVYTVGLAWIAEIDADNRRNYVIDWDDLTLVSDLSGGAGYGEEYNVEFQVSYSRDDVASGMAWTDYAPFTAGDFTGRHFRFRMVLTTTDALISPSVDDFTVTIDAPDRVERGEDVTSGTSTYSVTFGSAFMDVPNVSISAQDLATGDYWAISNKAPAGFDIDFYNSSATAVSRTFDWQAIGIGKEAA